MNIKEFLEAGGTILIDGYYATFHHLNNSRAMSLPHYYLFSNDTHEKDILSAYLKTMTNLYGKPKEQLDAEEAVEKAKASLEAAQKVLESVKGKNN